MKACDLLKLFISHLEPSEELCVKLDGELVEIAEARIDLLKNILLLRSAEGKLRAKPWSTPPLMRAESYPKFTALFKEQVIEAVLSNTVTPIKARGLQIRVDAINNYGVNIHVHLIDKKGNSLTEVCAARVQEGENMTIFDIDQSFKVNILQA